MNIVVAYGYGLKPMKLLTTKSVHSKNTVLSIVNTDCKCWRIEEL